MNEFSNESSMSLEQAATIIAPHFHAPDPQIWDLTSAIFADCVLGKVFEPRGALKQKWISPGERYRGQWIWDTMFVVDLLSALPGQDEVIREVFQNYWDFQDQWNATQPAYRHDMLACAMFCDLRARVITYSQVPIIAWGLERVYARNHDSRLLDMCLGRLEKFHEWYWRERDPEGRGLATVGAYSGAVQDARYETFDFECSLDDLQLTEYPGRAQSETGKWYGDISIPGMTAYLVMAEHSLARLAEIAGDTGMAARRRKKVEKAVNAMREHMWDEARGLFVAVKRESLEKVPVPTIGSWIPLTAGIPTPAMASRMAETFCTSDWLTPLPLPTVGRNDPHWDTSITGMERHRWMWRGDVWPPTNYQVATGFAAYGFKEIAALITDKTVENALTNGINERYHCDTGVGLGVKGLGMSCTIATMMLDGLSKTYQVELK